MRERLKKPGRLDVCVTDGSGACGEALDKPANESFVESFVGNSDYTGRCRFLRPWDVELSGETV